MRRWIAVCLLMGNAAWAAGTFRAGAHAEDITPRTFPIIVAGGFLAGTAERASGTLHARALALDDGRQRVIIAVVDTLMMPCEFVDRVKESASRRTGIPPERMLISATHTHSAPALMGCLGTDANPEYARLVEAQLVKAIEGAVKNLAPAQVGWTVIQDFEHTHCRQWILRPDRVRKDPFGELTVRSNMHPGYQNPDFVGPAGPVDPDLSILAFQSKEGRPLAVLANYSMHYVGAPAKLVSPDYYGPFVESLERLIGGRAMISQGTSGDQHWMDYSQPRKDMNLEMYADALARVAHEAYKKIEYRDSAPLAMAERKLRLARRLASPERLAWAKEILARMGNAPPRNQQEVYAREQVLIAQEPERELKLQALKIGDLGIAAIPDEVFAITGLKIKAQSPLRPTLTIELANGAEGYIPPPEQHKLGGYTTWAARTAGLEVNAEPKILEAVLGLLEEVSGQRRRALIDQNGPYAKAVLAAKPAAYWRLNESSGPVARDATGSKRHARHEDGIVFYLEGPASPVFSGSQINRAPHFAGGRMTANIEGVRDRYSLELWFYNGLPADARPVTGYLFSRGSDQLAIGGTERAAGRLLFVHPGGVLQGTTPLALRTWYHVLLVRDRGEVRVYLNGNSRPEISGQAAPAVAATQVFIGGRDGNVANFEGKIDEVAIFSRPLSAAEAANALSHFLLGRD